MKIYLNCTANLGDFSNALPVISGLSKHFDEKIDMIVRGEMRKFNGFKEFLSYQPMIQSVEYDDELFSYNSNQLILSSWTRMDQKNPNRPVETCRYENWVNDNYNIDFQVDDDFEVQVFPQYTDDLSSKTIIGDRWSIKQDPAVDTRRNTNVIENGVNPDVSKVHYLDYTKPLMYNLNLIKNNPNPLITTFTGIGIIADLMNKETIVGWDEDMRVWDGHPVEYDFIRHYYGNRKSKLVHVKDIVV
jgi:hypothetical protein